MNIAYNPLSESALSQAPSDNDILFDLPGKCIYARGVQFKGTDTIYQVFKKNTFSQGGGYNGLVPAPDYQESNSRYLREDGKWIIPESQYRYQSLNNTDLDTLRTEGRWYYIAGSSNNENGPDKFNEGSELYVGRNAYGYRYQKIIRTSGEVWLRIYNSSTWGAWKRWYVDGEVKQTSSTSDTMKPLVLGYTDAKNTSDLANSVINQVHVTTSLYANPKSGTLVANIFKGQLQGTIASNTTATTQQQTDNSTKVATTAFVRVAIANLVNGAPETLDTLKEIADYLQDGSVAGGIVQQLAKKVNKTGDTMSGDLTFASIGNQPTNPDDDFPVDSKGLKWAGSSDNASIFYRITASDTGNLVFHMGDDAGCNFIWDNSTNGEIMKLQGSGALYVTGPVSSSTFIGKLQGNADTATALTTSAGSAALPVYFSGGKPVACTGSSIFSLLSNDNNQLSITVAGQNRKLQVAYSKASDIANKLHNYRNRPTSANISNTNLLNCMEYYIATSSMTEGKPAQNGYILHFHWDNTNWASQIGISNSITPEMWIRTSGNTEDWAGRDWVTMLSSINTFIKDGKITINGTSVTPLTSLQTLTFTEGTFTSNNYNGTQAKTIKVPTKTSHLINDSGFVTDLSNLITIEKNLTITQKWMDTGIQGNSLQDGTYIVQVTINSSDNGMWNIFSSGVMSWYSGNTNDTEEDEIILHRVGHAYGSVIYLRTIQLSGGTSGMKLQISSSKDFTKEAKVTFKFKKII